MSDENYAHELVRTIMRLQNALLPFAEMAEGIDDWADEAPVVENWPEMPESWGNLTVGDLRAARDALLPKARANG